MPQYAEIIIKGHVPSSGSRQPPIMNTFHYGLATPSASASKAALWAIFNSQVMAQFENCINATYVGDYATIRWLDDATDPPVVVGAPPNGAAGTSTDALPVVSAVYVKLKAGIKGRSGRGSKHFCPISEPDTTNNELNTSNILNWQALANNCAASLLDSNGLLWLPMVVSRLPPAQYEENPVTVVANQIMSYVLNLTIGTMRKRREKTAYINSLRPTVTGLAPSTGTHTGGTAVTVTGTNLIGVTNFAFGGVPATSVVILSPTSATCVSPAHAAATVDVIATSTYGSSPAVAGDQFIYT